MSSTHSKCLDLSFSILLQLTWTGGRISYHLTSAHCFPSYILLQGGGKNDPFLTNPVNFFFFLPIHSVFSLCDKQAIFCRKIRIVENTYCGKNNSHLLSMFKQNYAQSWVLVLIIQVKECSEEARHERCLHQWLYILKLKIRALVIKKVCAPCFDFEIWTQIDF